MEFIKVSTIKEPLKAYDVPLKNTENEEIAFVQGMNENGYFLISEQDLSKETKRLIFQKEN